MPESIIFSSLKELSKILYVNQELYKFYHGFIVLITTLLFSSPANLYFFYFLVNFFRINLFLIIYCGSNLYLCIVQVISITIKTCIINYNPVYGDVKDLQISIFNIYLALIYNGWRTVNSLNSLFHKLKKTNSENVSTPKQEF